MVTSVYFVRHAEREKNWKEDFSRPLSETGKEDCKKVTYILRNCQIDVFVSSPYKRSIDTIRESSKEHNIEIFEDIRLRERLSGVDGNNLEMFKARWNDLNYCENGGESLNMLQKRNIEALEEILIKYAGKNIVIGTHGTALSTILNYYDNSFGCNDFLRITDFMPYIVKLDFNGLSCIEKKEILIVHKPYNT